MAVRGIAVAAAVIVLAAASVLGPVWTYALSLALFGLPHVACELRYVDQRFGSRIGARTAALLGTGLLLVALLRLAAVGRIGDAETRLALELGLGALLALAVLPVLAAQSTFAAVLGILAVLLGWTMAARTRSRASSGSPSCTTSRPWACCGNGCAGHHDAGP